MMSRAGHRLLNRSASGSIEPERPALLPLRIIMKLHRRKLLYLAAGAAALPAASRIASAQAYPARPVHILVGYGAGSTPDIYARVVADWLSQRLGQTFV